MKTWKKLNTKQISWEKFFIREKIIKVIRNFFYQKKFHEVETPLLVPSVIPESYLEVFKTYLKDHKDQQKKMFLTTSPEASIKKLLVAGIGNCFEITKSFRNGESSSFHNPEFTILEWYRVGATYKEVMKDCEDLVVYICKKLKTQNSKLKTTTEKLKLSEIIYQGKIIDLAPPWERISVAEAFQKYAGVNFSDISFVKNNKVVFPVNHLAEIALKKGYQIQKNASWEEIFHQIFFNEIEPNLGKTKPTIIYDYPKPLAALAKIKQEDPRFAQRFEFYTGGLELGDCYTELTDWQEQKTRFSEELEAIKKSGKTPVLPDKDFLDALKIGLPDCSGIAVGVDRLVMLFTNSKTIQETLLFPI